MSRVEQTKEKCSMGEVACIENVVDDDFEINFANLHCGQRVGEGGNKVAQ